ncbi:hypothetical protein FBU30_007701 [Linnemannia zychae]|nr:hypothetical protein FBU30_007701 [Linnemannia zychae]
MKSLPSDRALATAALPSSTALISTTVVAAVTEATPIATPVAEKEQGAHGSQANPRDRASLVANLVSRDRNSPDQQDSYSNVNSDAPMIEASTVHHDSTSALQSAQSVHLRHPSQQHPYQSSEPIGCSHILDYHFPSLNHASSTSSLSAATAANTAAAAASSTKYVDSPLERKSHLKRKYNRLLAKNAALKATVLQVKSDLALERQKRTTVDQIYLNIRKDLNQRLESEEDKVLSLKADLEQMVAEIKELKDQLATARSRSTPFPISASMSSGFNSRAANGYRIGYDSSTFSLSRGISALGGIHMPHNSALIDGQDDSDEFLFSRPYSSSPRRASVSQSNNKDSTLMSCSDNETDDDEEMEEEDESDDDACGINKGIFLFKKPPTSRRTSISSSMSLRTLTEEIIKEEEEEEEEIGEMDEEDEVDSDLEDRTNNMDEVSGSDAPRTMMEIILQRQQSHSPEDDVEDPPADANETFDTMTHKTLLQAIRSRLTVAQAHLHIEELVLKYDAPLHKTIAAITRALLQWWEMERVSTGGPITGGFGTNLVVINKETGEQVAPKVAIEKKIESFFGPLLLQFVASIDEQKMLLESLGQLAQTEPEGRWLRNHSGILVALYKYDVLDGESILEWWRSLEEPQGVFGHGENNLRSLNSRFIAWLEDEDEESDTESDIEEEDDEEGESDFDSSCSEFESDSEDDDNDDDNGSNCQKEIIGKVTDVNNLKDQDSVVEAILDVAYPSSTPSSPRTTAASDDYKDSEISNTTSNMKRRISFCTKNNLYYSQDGKVHHAPTHKPRKVRAGDMDINRDSEDEVEDEEDDIREDDPVVKKKYDQCPPFRGLMDRDLEIGTMA